MTCLCSDQGLLVLELRTCRRWLGRSCSKPLGFGLRCGGSSTASRCCAQQEGMGGSKGRWPCTKWASPGVSVYFTVYVYVRSGVILRPVGVKHAINRFIITDVSVNGGRWLWQRFQHHAFYFPAFYFPASGWIRIVALLTISASLKASL